ncbi:MAG: hypothetical protein JWL79_2968 [Frankiales bacterium]|nr:hypothetical protein [Frankiales bacterium]
MALVVRVAEMKGRGAGVVLAAVLLLGGGGFAALSSTDSSSLPTAPGPTPSSSSPGILRLLSENRYPSLDPARLTSPRERDVGRLLYRTLMTYGPDGTSLVPDLSSAAGVPSDGGRAWTYHLQPGVEYQNGRLVVAADVVRGLTRAVAAHAPPGELVTATAVNPSTVVLRFAKPFVDADAVSTLMATAPVPATGPLATGPYTVASLRPGVSFRLAPNLTWSGTTLKVDAVEIDGELGLDGATIDRRILAGRGGDAWAVTDKPLLEPTTSAPKQRVIKGRDASVLFTALNTRRGPFADLKVRQAFEVAYPLKATRAVAGGSAVGDFATDLLPPYLPSHVDADVYGQQEHDFTGDPVRARRMLTDAGYPDGVSVTTVVPTTGTGAADALRAGLAPAGFRLRIRTVAAASYYAVIGVPATQPDLAGYAWSPDWLTPGAYLAPLFTCAALTPRDNHNVADHCDRGFDAQLDAALAETDNDVREREWSALNRRLVEEAVIVPRFYGLSSSLAGAGVEGARSSLAFGGAVDVGNVTVR